MAVCRECGAAFDREPGAPRVCGPCLPAFKARLVREGTPIRRCLSVEEVLGDDEAVQRIKRLSRKLALLTTASPSIDRSPAGRRRGRLTREERAEAASKARSSLERALAKEDTGRLRYWASAAMFDLPTTAAGASGAGGVNAAAARVCNGLAMAEIHRRSEAWRRAGLGPVATVDAVRAAGLESTGR